MQTIDKFSSQSSTSKLLKDKASVEHAYQEALDRGFSPEDINIIMSEDTRDKFFSNSSNLKTTVVGDKSMEGLAIGGATGGSIIGIASAIAALGATLTVPGLNLVVAGPLAAGLVGAGLGSVTGGIIGALVGAGIPEERVKEYEEGIKSGGVVLSVAQRKNLSTKGIKTKNETKFG